MPNYRRVLRPGGTFFFTLVTHDRQSILLDAAARTALRHAIARTRHDHPFELDAIVVLPDHLHAIWTLPADDADFSTRWRLIKARFTREWRAFTGSAGLPSRPTFTRASRGERAVWQQRFWEHSIRDNDDLERHMDYIHFNPIKHGLTTCPHAWEWSSFARCVTSNIYPADWCCSCDNRCCHPPDFAWADELEME